MRRKGFISDTDTARILRRYSAVTILGLLREISKCDNARLDWNVLVKKSTTGISCAREYQALWRHIAYRSELADFYADDAKLAEDESDLEFELLPSPVVSSDISAEVVRWVKADVQRSATLAKKKVEVLSKSKSRDAGLAIGASQAPIPALLSSSSIDVSHKRTPTSTFVSAEDVSSASPPAGSLSQVLSATPEGPSGILLRGGLGQSERKKRKLWSFEEDQELIAAVEKFGEGNWTNILKGAFTHDRTAAQLSQRWALIRKRREVQAAANKLTSVNLPSCSADGQGSGIQTSPETPSLRANTAENAGNPVSTSPHSSSANGSVNEVGSASATLGSCTSTSGSQSQVHVSSSLNVSNKVLGSEAKNSAVNSLVATCGDMDSSALKGGVVQPGGTPTWTGTASGQQQPYPVVASHGTSGASTSAGVLAADQLTSAGGGNRLIAPGAVVMSAAAAQAACVGGSEMWQSSLVPSAGSSKYAVRSNVGLLGGRKPVTGPNPGVQAAAVAAGARIAPASAAASLLKAAQSGNVVHIGPGGVPITKSGLPGQTGTGHNSGVGARGSNVHYICTSAGATPSTLQGMSLSCQKNGLQPKSQSTKSLGANQSSTVLQTTSLCTTPSNFHTRPLPPI